MNDTAIVSLMNNTHSLQGNYDVDIKEHSRCKVLKIKDTETGDKASATLYNTGSLVKTTSTNIFDRIEG